MTLSPRKLIAEFVKPGVAAVSLITRAGQSTLGAAAALTMLVALAGGASPTKAAEAAATLEIPAAGCFWEFAQVKNVNGWSVAMIENGKAVLLDDAADRADDLVAAHQNDLSDDAIVKTADKLLADCAEKIAANPNMAFGNLDRAQLDDWFSRRPAAARPAIRIH